MSVINQMLNGLEQRGVQVATEQVRPVHETRDTNRAKIALFVVLIIAIAALVWRAAAKPPALATAVVAEAEPAPVREVAKKSSPPNSEAATRVYSKAPDQDARHVKSPSTEKKPAAVHKEKPPVRVVDNTVRQRAEASVQPVKQISVAQQADAEFRKAAALMQQGRNAEAMAGFESVLRLDAGHEAARGALVTLLMEGKRGGEAERVLQHGLKHKPENSGFAMLLARLQIQRNDLDSAITTLENTLNHAEQQADYHAFYAALLQRKNRHGEAVEHYQLALKSAPNAGVWLMGYGISLQALSLPAEAKEAYQRALDSKTLSPELQAFVQQKINKP